jgi:hypothetical protein
MYEANKRLAPWRAEIVKAAEARAEADRLGDARRPRRGADRLLPAPPQVGPGRGSRWPCVKPDGDKLTRAVFDSLTIARVIADDARIVHHDVWKRYARQTAGVRIRVSAMTNEGALL